MDKITTPALSRLITVTAAEPSRTNPSGSFKEVMAEFDHLKSSQAAKAQVGQPILVGEITADTPTISELLVKHRELDTSTWDIINSEQNKGKDYHNIQPGTRIYYDRTTGVLSWAKPGSSSPPEEPTATAARATQGNSLLQQEFSSQAKQSIQLGRIDKNNPTVSHLLKNHPQLRDQTWDLLANSTNKNKPFNRIGSGTEIFFNVETREITWNSGGEIIAASRQVGHRAPPPLPSPPALVEHSSLPPTDLSEAVKKYMGTSYEEMNCYELLVKGLHHMDIPYSGKDGLFSKLTRMAVDKGMAPNAYLNGEGIVKAAGSLVLSKNYTDIDNWKNQSAALVKEIEPLLDNGQILSFSTEKRGHTGIVSQKNNQWTFINSGRLDNSVDLNSLPHGVGEEILIEEIGNWFKSAQDNRETLSVTLGHLVRGRIHTASTFSEAVSKQI